MIKVQRSICYKIHALQKIVKFPHILCVGKFGETGTFLKVSYEGNGNFRFPSISQRKLSVSVKFHAKTKGNLGISCCDAFNFEKFLSTSQI